MEIIGKGESKSGNSLANCRLCGSMVNTIAVMGSIYVLFAKEYAQAREVGITAVWGLIMGTITASGIPEAIAAAVLVLALGKVLLSVFKKM